MLKWTLIILGTLVLLIAIVAIVGALLPRGHVATRTARIKAKPDAVWQVLTRVEELPSWRSDLTGVERLPDRGGLPIWREKGRNGTMTIATEEFSPPSRLRTRIADEGLPFGGSWTWELTPDGDGTKIRITENGEIYNPIFRFMARFVFGYAATMEQMLKSLGKRFGEDNTPVTA